MKQKIMVLLFLLTCLTYAFATVSKTESQPSRDPFTGQIYDIVPNPNGWTKNYYISPKPNDLPLVINYAIKYKIFDYLHQADESEGQIDYIMPFSYFAAKIFANHPEHIPLWMNQINFTSNYQRKIIYSALWESNTDTGEKYLLQIAHSNDAKTANIAKAIMAKPRQEVLQKKINLDTLDELWASFFATGENKYIARIISVLSWQNPLLGNDDQLPKERFYKILTYLAAKWSLYANAKQDPNILNIGKKMLSQLDPATQVILKQLLTENEVEYNKTHAAEMARFNYLIDKHKAMQHKK